MQRRTKLARRAIVSIAMTSTAVLALSACGGGGAAPAGEASGVAAVTHRSRSP